MPDGTSAKSVILAMLCSNPDTKNANTHQKAIMSFPLSDLAFAAHRIARQTSRLHKIPRSKSSKGVADVFMMAMSARYFRMALP